MEDRLGKYDLGEDAGTRNDSNPGSENADSAPPRFGGGDGSSGTSTSELGTGPPASPPAVVTTKRVGGEPPPMGLAGKLHKYISDAANPRPPQNQTAPSGPLAYLFSFPEPSCNRVRAEMLKADRDFAQEEHTRFLTYEERRAFAIRWICRILAVFASEACNLVRSGAADWSLSQIEPRVNEVLRLLTLMAEDSKFVGGNKPDLTNSYGNVREEVHAEIARSTEWSQYQDKLLDLMDQCTPATEANVSTEATSSRPSDECGNCSSEAQRIDAVAAYTQSWQCSGAALARTARVHPGDLSKWKKDKLPVESDKKARIEKALKNNEAPTPSAKRSRNS